VLFLIFCWQAQLIFDGVVGETQQFILVYCKDLLFSRLLQFIKLMYIFLLTCFKLFYLVAVATIKKVV
jgi:hypothetical protein